MVESDERWSFFLNPAGSELPLKGSEELRRDLLRIPEGESVVDAFGPVQPDEYKRFNATSNFGLYVYIPKNI